MTQKPGLIDQTLVHGDLLFTTSKYRCRYIGLSARDQLLWRQNNVGKWQRIQDVQEEAAPPVENETNVGAAPAGPNGRTSSRDVQKTADEDHVALVDPLPGDRSPPYQPTSLPTPVKANVPNGPTKAELLPPAVAAMREAKGSQTETTPLGATGRKRGRSGGCQLKKQKPLGGSSKAGPKLSPERMRLVLDSLAEYPIKGHAATKAGIFRKTLDYWLKGSAAGQDQYDVEWRGETWKFHEHFEAAMAEADDKLFAAMLDIAMGAGRSRRDHRQRNVYMPAGGAGRPAQGWRRWLDHGLQLCRPGRRG